MKKRIVLCADDYGQAPAISQGILALVCEQRLSAVSCMVTGDHWPMHAEWLKPHQDKVDIGLHVNLTEGKAPLNILMLKAIFRQLNAKSLEAALHSQLDAFATAMGRLPDFIDGHQHVHHFPMVRDALIKVYQARLQEKRPYVRYVNLTKHWLDVKKAVVHNMGANRLLRYLKALEIPYNQTFSGMYDFSENSDYASLFQSFLAEVGDRGLIMCHPGMLAVSPADPIAAARFREYQYFSSPQLMQDCTNQGVVIARFC